MSIATKVIPIKKYSYEEILISWDFTNDFEIPGEAISLGDSDVAAVDKSGNDSATTFIDIATKANKVNELQILCRSGSSALSPYTVKFKCVSTLGYKYQGNITVEVLD